MNSIRRDEEQAREEIEMDMSVHKRGKGDEEPVIIEMAGEVDSGNGIDESQSKAY